VPGIRLNATELFYSEVGEGIPCLVMHGGLGFDHTCMHPWLVIVAGRDDFVTPPSQTRILLEGIQASEIIDLERSGHMPWLEEPDAFFDAIRGWVERA
jgi:hypothetical protein